MNATRVVVAVLALSFALSACATVTGPEITSEEERQARALLRAEAEAFQKAQQKKLVIWACVS